MNQPVQDGIGERGVADGFVPMLDGQLAGDEGGAGAVTVVKDFQQVAALAVAEACLQAPVFQHRHVDFGKLVHQFRVAPVAMCDFQFRQQPGQALVGCLVTRPAGFLGKCAHQK